MSLSEPELKARYRNLLIMLAVDIVRSKEVVDKIKVEADKEKAAGRKAGLRAIIRCRNRCIQALEHRLAPNRASLRHFFGTTKTAEIAKQKIILH